MVYLIYRQDHYFGFTYSKKVAKKIKNLDSSYRTFQTGIIPDDDDRFADIYQIDIYTLKDANDQDQEVISNDFEIHEIFKWVLMQSQYYIVDPVADMVMKSQFSLLPKRIRRLLKNYIEYVESIFYMDIDRVQVSELDFVTYEAYVLYLAKHNGKEMIVE